MGEGDGIWEEVLIPGWDGALGDRQVIARACGLLCGFQQENLGRERTEGQDPGQARDRCALGMCAPMRPAAPQSQVWVITSPLLECSPYPYPPLLPVSGETLDPGVKQVVTGTPSDSLDSSSGAVITVRRALWSPLTPAPASPKEGTEKIPMGLAWGVVFSRSSGKTKGGHAGSAWKATLSSPLERAGASNPGKTQVLGGNTVSLTQESWKSGLRGPRESLLFPKEVSRGRAAPGI